MNNTMIKDIESDIAKAIIKFANCNNLESNVVIKGGCFSHATFISSDGANFNVSMRIDSKYTFFKSVDIVPKECGTEKVYKTLNMLNATDNFCKVYLDNEGCLVVERYMNTLEVNDNSAFEILNSIYTNIVRYMNAR